MSKTKRCEYWENLAEVLTALKDVAASQLPFCLLSSLENIQSFLLGLLEKEAEKKKKERKKRRVPKSVSKDTAG